MRKPIVVTRQTALDNRNLWSCVEKFQGFVLVSLTDNRKLKVVM